MPVTSRRITGGDTSDGDMSIDVVGCSDDVRGFFGGGIAVGGRVGDVRRHGGGASASVGNERCSSRPPGAGGSARRDGGAAAGIGSGVGEGRRSSRPSGLGDDVRQDGGAAADVGGRRYSARPSGDPVFVVPPQACSTLRSIMPRFGIGGASPDQQQLWNPVPPTRAPVSRSRRPSMCQKCGHNAALPIWKSQHSWGGRGKSQVPEDCDRQTDKPNWERNRFGPSSCEACR